MTAAVAMSDPNLVPWEIEYRFAFLARRYTGYLYILGYIR